jgi:hypothetical protein
MHYKRSRTTTRKELKRIDHKKSRSAEDQALRGDHHRTVRSDKWSLRPDQPPLLETHRPPASKKNRKKWCKGRPGRKHVIVYKTLRTVNYGERTYSYGGYVCDNCGRHMWGYKPPALPLPKYTNDHWRMSNIQLRLAGHPCQCETCP